MPDSHDRRTFLATLGAAALTLAARRPVPLITRRRLKRIGLQLYTVRDEMKKDVEATIARVAATGYTEVEFAGYFGRAPRDLRALLDHNGLSSPSSHISLAPDQWRAALDAAGAKDITPFVDDNPPGLTIHEMGTARMGRDPKTAVLNAHNQCHDVKNLFVTDGACMASSANQNPSITYMALTARAAAYAVDAMKRNEL